MNRQMNQMSGEHRPGFTPKQGQYLAFIDAYARVHRPPPAEADMQKILRRNPAFGPPDDSHPRTRRPYSTPTGRAPQHRDSRPSRGPTRLASSNPTGQNLCAEVLASTPAHRL